MRAGGTGIITGITMITLIEDLESQFLATEGAEVTELRDLKKEPVAVSPEFFSLCPL